MSEHSPLWLRYTCIKKRFILLTDLIMDNTVVKPYTDALSAQKAKLDGYVADSFKAIAIPATKADVQVGSKSFLTVSGIWFLVVAIIGFFIGIIMKSNGLLYAAAAALLSAGYVYIKGKQALHAEAYASLGQSIYNEIAAIVTEVSNRWSTFMAGQNDSLKKAVVASDATPDAKVAIIDDIESTPAVTVNLSQIQSELQTVGAEENPADYRTCLAKAQSAVAAAIDTAEGAQSTIYSTIAK